MTHLLCAAVLMLASTLLLADGAPVLDTVPITGAYTAHYLADRDHVTIIELAGNYNEKLDNGSSNLEPRAVIAREFFRTHPDEYDFIVAFSTFEYDTGQALAFHWGVQNKVMGIGQPLYDNTAFFGSQGKLQGFIDMAALTRYATDPLNPEFEKVLSTLAHEMLHQWAAGVRFKDASGNLSDALLGKDNAHWSFLLNSNASVEYGNLWKDNGDGTFTSTGTRKFYSPLDLYLMGFYKPEEVPPFYLIENPTIDKRRLPEENVTISGTQRWVTIEEIIAAEGPRIPAAAEAQKDFRIAFVLLTGPGQNVSDAQIAALNNVRNAYMTRFAVLSGGRGVAQIYPEAMPEVTTGTPTTVGGDTLRTDPANLDAALAWLRGQQKPEGEWLDKTTTDIRDTTITLQALTKLDPSFNNAASGLSWLSQKPSRNTDYLARYATTLREIGGDASALRTQLVTRQNSDGGFGIAPGYLSDPLDTALALQALAGSAEAPVTKLDSAAQYLLGKQNSDGGFSPAEGGPSRTSVTATALSALKAVNKHAAIAPTALAFLASKQNPDGGFGDSPSTVHDTANALMTFMSFESLPQIQSDSAANFLLGQQTVTGSWDGSVYSTASAVMALKRFKYPNWTVLSVTADPVTVNDGNRIQLTIRVRNDSSVSAPEGRLRLYDGDPSQGGVAFGPDITIPSMAGGTELVFTPFWDSFDKAGAHSLYAVVDPDNTQTEMSERDNRGSVNVTVQSAPQGIDLTFGEPGISVSPVQPNRLPTSLSISVAVRNLGLTDAQGAHVILWDGAPGSGTMIGETTIDVLGRSTVVANFTYVLKRSGRTLFTAQVDSSNTISEVSETNNTATAEINTAPSIDLVVLGSDITVDKNPAIVGNDITFKVTLRNEGTSDSPSTDVRYLVTDGTTTKELQVNSIQLAAGQSTEQTITWRVDLSGNLTFTTQIDPSGLLPELDETNNVATLNFMAGEPSGVNLAVSYKDLTFTPNPGREGYPAILSVLVRNTGTVTANNAEISFYTGDPSSGGTAIGSYVIPSLAAGATTQAAFTWQAIPDSSDKLIYVVADPANAIAEFSEDDNTAFNVLPVLSLPDLAISAADVQLMPLFPKAGDTITISVRVANLGAQEASNVPVRIYDGDPASGGTQIGDATIPLIAGYGTAYAEITWTPTEATLHNLVVQVDPANAILEKTKTNNSVRRDVLIQDGNLNVTQKYFSPNGDGVKDTTQLFFRVPVAGTAKVDVLNKRDKVIRHFTVPVNTSGSGATITWDGLDDLGRLVQDGLYRLRVIDTMGATFGEVSVQLDTNRSSLLEAAGTKYESYTNLTCDLPDVTGFTMTNDDSKAFFAIQGVDPRLQQLLPPPGTTWPTENYPRGIYRMEGDGTDVRAIVPNTWPNFERLMPTGVLAAGNGSRVLFTLNTVPPSYWVADGDGRNLAQLNYTAPSGGQASPWYISQDGTTVYVVDYSPSTASTRLLGIQNGGTGDTRVVATISGAAQGSGGSGSGEPFNEIEPNNPIASAQYVSSPTGNVTINGVLGVISGSTIDDLDFYRFYGREGDLVTIDIDCAMNCGQRSFDSMVYLFGDGPSYPVLIMNDDGGAYDSGSRHPYDSLISNYRLPTTGYYTVGVTNYGRWLSNGGAASGYITNGDYILNISGISSAPSSGSSAFSPDDSKVALITSGSSGGSVLSIVDLKTGAMVKPFGDGVALNGYIETKWSPNSKRLAVSDTANHRVLVYDQNGSLIRQFSVADAGGGATNLALRNIEWSSSGAEFAFRASSGTSGSTQPGGLYFADIVTGEVAQAAGYRNNSSEAGFDPWGSLYWVPGERSLLYREGYQQKDTAILLDDNNLQKVMFKDWAGDFSSFFFSPTGRQAIFGSDRAATDATSACYMQGHADFWSFKSLLNLTADLRAIRSATAGGVQLRGTAADANFAKYQLDYAAVETPNDWHPIAPPATEMVVDTLFTTWIPSGPGNYLVRLSVEDLAGNVRRTIKRVSWSDTPSITDVYRTPAIISPNGDGVNDNAIIHYRVLEPVHLTFEFFNENGTRVRVINRDHSTYGIDAELLWDGRDSNGLVVPDGRYRMTVQNYEFYVTVDNTPPEALIQIRNAYQSIKVADPNNPTGAQKLYVFVNPGIFWKAADLHLDTNVIESGVGADPFDWNEQTLGGSCAISPPPGQNDPQCNTLTLADFTGHSFRIEAADTAGNRSVNVTTVSAEQLIVDRGGNHKKAPCDTDCSANNDYYALNGVPYVPMSDTDGGALQIEVGLNPVRFRVAETIGRPIAQLYVQYRPASDSAWRESALNQFMIQTGGSGLYERLAITDTPTEQVFNVVWDLAGVDGGTPYVVRLRSIDASGQEHYSNTFRIHADGLIFLGKESSSIPDEIKQRLLNENPPASNDYLLWGKEFVADAIDKVRLIVSSKDDPRYAIPQEIGVVSNPDMAFMYRTSELQTCKTYTGYLEATVSTLDSATGAVVTKTLQSGPRDIRMPCLELRVRSEVVPAASCADAPRNEVKIKFAPAAMDGKALKLLTLSQPLPDNAGDDVLYNVNYPNSVTLPQPPAEPNYIYTYTLNTSQYPEGVLNLTAKLLNVEDEETVVNVPILVDHTPPVARITYPLEGQRLCGVPKSLPDGKVHNTLTFEGELSDAGGFDYTLELGEGATPATFTKFHDSQSKDSFKIPSTISPRKPFGLFSIAGPIGQIYDRNGEFTVRMNVSDAGGYKRCDSRTFYFDGVVEGARASIDRRLFSPNGDGQFDEVVVNYGTDETVTVDVELYKAVAGYSSYSIIGDKLLTLLSQMPLLSGESQIGWDGRDASGNMVADGWYGLRVIIKDTCGNTRTIDTFTEVDTTAPAVSIAYPKSTDQLPLSVEIQGAVSDAHLLNYAVEIGVGVDPASWIRIASKTANTTGTQTLAIWNTYGLEGPYSIRVVAIDVVGNASNVEVPVTLAERVNLISYLESLPELFSPNADGKLESTAIRFGLEQDSLVTLAIQDASGTIKKSIYNQRPFSLGPVSVSWDGTDDSGKVLADGRYSVSLLVASAANPLLRQDEKVSVVIDKTAPYIEVTRPASGFISANGNIVGTIQDANITGYDVFITSEPQAPVWTTLDSGTTNRINTTLGSVSDQEEGDYALKIEAVDLGETKSTKIIPFIIDRTLPKVSITAPQANSVVGRNKSPINVTGTMEETYLSKYVLSVGNGAAPSVWTPLATGTTLPLPSVIHAWDISAANDGVYTLQLRGEDMAGNAGESRVSITVDNTPPTAALASPSDGSYIKAPQNITGTATDPNFAQYRLEVSPGTIAEASRWSELTIGAQPVNNGTLLHWDTLPPDGVYTLRLTVQDLAENVSTAVAQITVDTNPPTAPINLVAALENRNNVRLTWNASTDNDLAGYAVYRDGVRITADLIADATYYDPSLIEGRYVYTVKAIDKAGWESGASNEAVVIMDVTPPTTRISSPSSGTTVSGLLDIKGTAYSTDDFKEYRLYVAKGLTPTDYQLLIRSPVPVLADVLSQWNTLVLEEGADYTLKLEAEDINGNIGVDQISVKIDNLPPAAPSGLAATVSGSNATLTWNANTETDLLGYLVFRNERLANLSGVLVGSLKPYAILTTTYVDLSLADGAYTYYLLAIDKAGNISDPSTAIEVSIDTRAPHAVIVQPAANTSFDNPLYVLASSPDTDIASVRFQYRTNGTTTWIDLGDLDTALPYATTFNPAALNLAYGYYQLQAVATDYGNRVDSAPTPITVQYKDVSAPSATRDLRSRVDGGQVNLSWTANTEADLAGYHIDRRDSRGLTVRLTSSPVTQNSYTDSGVADGTYYYTVVAVDAVGNLADPSNQSQAIVYTPVLVQLFTPTTETLITLNGHGIGAAVVSGDVTSAGSTPITPVNTDAEGNFAAPVSLGSGLNTITVRLTDSVGNVSKPASVNVTSAQPPSKPTGLAATVTNYDVALAWNPNPETNVVGYRVFRDGAALATDQAVTGATATASSTMYDYYYGPAKAVDSDIYSFWSPNVSSTRPSNGQWLAVNLSTPRIVTYITVRWSNVYYSAIDFDIEAWTGTAWLKVAEVRDNSADVTTVTLPKPYRTQNVRLVLRKINGTDDSYWYSLRLSDFKVYYRPLVANPSSHDITMDGLHSYTVSAVNSYGFESLPSDPLSVAVGDVTPPEPVTLSASVTGTDVTLTWGASTSSDVTRYTIYRDGVLIATLNNSSTTQYLDTGLANGTYSYIVKAIDTHNNVSAPSNEAPATIAILPPAAPVNLTVTSMQNGGVLQLAWMAGDSKPVASYRLFRSTVANGPYDLIGTVADTQYLDTGLINGTRYYYVVAALDSLDNVSAYSNEANGIPLDQAAPQVAITYPATPGNSYQTTDPAVTIAGLTDAGASVALYRNGQLTSGVVAAGSVVVNATQLSLSWPNSPLSPDGRYLVSQQADGVSLYDFSTNTSRTVVNNNNSNWVDMLEWSRDGGRLLFIDYDNQLSSVVMRSYRLSDSAVDTVANFNQFPRMYGGALSEDGNKFAIIGYNQNWTYGLWSFDLSTNSIRLLKELINDDIESGSLRWSPNGRKLAYLRMSYATWPETYAIDVFDVDTGVVKTLDQQIVYGRPAWSPDSTEVLYTAQENGTAQVWRYRLGDNSSEALTHGSSSHTGPQWLPDDRGFAYVEDTSRVLLQERSTGNVSTLAESDGLDGFYAQQVSSGYFAYRNTTGIVRVAPAGRFEARGVQLTAGDNVFTAVARDSSGNTSSPSLPVIVNYNMGERPDLSLSSLDIRVLPSPTVIGSTTNITVTVHNEGTLASPLSKLTVMAIDEHGSGHLLLSDALVAAIQPQGTFTLPAIWTPAAAGTYSLVATIDPMNNISETNESNNFAMREVVAYGEAAPAVSVALERNAISPNEVLTGTVTLGNAGNAVSGTLVIAVEDEAGYMVQILSSTQVTVAFGQSQSFTASWPSGSTFAGNYQLSAQLVDTQGIVLARDSKTFTLTAASEFAAQVTTDLTSYGANADVHVSGQATYTTGNALVSDARLHLLLLDANDQIITEKTELLGDLMPGAENTISMTWNTGLVVGAYTTQLRVESSDAVLAQAQSAFMIVSSGPVLRGTLSLSDASPAPGTSQQVSFTIENSGNTPAIAQPIRIALVNTSGTVIASETSLVDLASGGHDSGSASFATTGLALANYQVLLQAEVKSAPGTYTTLATAAFTLVDRTAPAIAINAPIANGYFTSNAQPIVFARDDLSSISLVEVRLDGANWIPAPVHDAAQSLYAATLPLMQEGAHLLEARATDTYGNTALAGSVTFIVDNTPPQISISGVANDGLYNHDVSATITIKDANLVESNVSLNGAVYSGALVTAEGNYQLTAQARDAAGNTTQSGLWFAIDKTAPVITISGVEEGGLYRTPVTPLITISDPHLVNESVTLNGVPYAVGTPIHIDGHYTLVATASDGATNSSSASISFEIDATPPAPPVITHPGEGETVNTRILDITGKTEANATVYLVRDNGEIAIFADATGAFLFPQAAFNEGGNSFAVYAKDRAGNIGASTTIHFRVTTDVSTLTGSVHAPSSVLVFIPNTKSAEDSKLQKLIESTLKENRIDYMVVNDEAAFISALRSTRYAVVLMTELHPDCDKTLTNNCGNNGEQLKLSLSSEKELRTTIAAGTGLVWIKPDSDANEHFSDLLGAKTRGLLPAPSMLALETSPASDAGQWAISGVAHNVEATSGTAVGQLTPSDAPALVLNTYGDGPVALVTFDPSALDDTPSAQNMIKRWVTYATPSRRALVPGGLAEISFRASKLRPPVTVRFDETVASPLIVEEAFDGTVASPTFTTWTRMLTSAETEFVSLVRLPTAAGIYEVTGTLFDVRSGAPSILKSLSLQVTLGSERDKLAATTMEVLTMFEAGTQYETRRDQAIELVHEATMLPQTSRVDTENAIKLLLDAVVKLQGIPGSEQPIGAIGRLLQTYQLAWAKN